MILILFSNKLTDSDGLLQRRVSIVRNSVLLVPVAVLFWAHELEMLHSKTRVSNFQQVPSVKLTGEI